MVQDGEYTYAPEKPLRITGDDRSIKLAETLIREILAEKSDVLFLPSPAHCSWTLSPAG
jgi:hypothetical protein